MGKGPLWQRPSLAKALNGRGPQRERPSFAEYLNDKGQGPSVAEAHQWQRPLIGHVIRSTYYTYVNFYVRVHFSVYKI